MSEEFGSFPEDFSYYHLEEESSSPVLEEESSSPVLEEESSSPVLEEESSSQVVQTVVYELSSEESAKLSNINATVTFATILIGIVFIIWLFDFVVKKLSHYL